MLGKQPAPESDHTYAADVDSAAVVEFPENKVENTIHVEHVIMDEMVNEDFVKHPEGLMENKIPVTLNIPPDGDFPPRKTLSALTIEEIPAKEENSTNSDPPREKNNDQKVPVDDDIAAMNQKNAMRSILKKRNWEEVETVNSELDDVRAKRHRDL